MVTRRKFSREFKLEAVKLVKDSSLLRRVTMERDILRKALGYFAKDPQ
jgi:transposase-like protein